MDSRGCTHEASVGSYLALKDSRQRLILRWNWRVAGGSLEHKLQTVDLGYPANPAFP